MAKKPALKFVSISKTYTPTKATPRDKFIRGQEQQKAAFQAIVRDKEDGYFVTVGKKSRKVRPHWMEQNGKVFYMLKYGARQLTIDGNNAVELNDIDDVPATIKTIIEMAQAGDFDKVLEELTSTIGRARSK